MKNHAGHIYAGHISKVHRMLDKIDRVRNLKLQLEKMIDHNAPAEKILDLNDRIYQMETDNDTLDHEAVNDDSLIKSNYRGSNKTGRLWTF